jgi:hypothetical protein
MALRDPMKTAKPATSLEDVGATVRNISPLLAGKIDRVRALTKQEGGAP